MPRLDLTAYGSFLQLISQRGIRPRSFETNLEAMEAVEIMATSCELGDQVLAFAGRGRISPHQAEALLLELITCFTDPLEQAKRIIEIGKELRGYEK